MCSHTKIHVIKRQQALQLILPHNIEPHCLETDHFSPKVMPLATFLKAGLEDMSSHHAFTLGRLFMREAHGVFMK